MLSSALLVAALAPAPAARQVRGQRTWSQCQDQPPAWYGSAEAVRVADQVLLYQRRSGGWPKNIDMARAITDAERREIAKTSAETDSTIDNGATTTQLRFLAQVYDATRANRFRTSFEAGFDYLLAAQYPNGGWPQFYPLRGGYSDHITYNDDAMIGVMRLLRSIAVNEPDYAFSCRARPGTRCRSARPRRALSP